MNTLNIAVEDKTKKQDIQKEMKFYDVLYFLLCPQVQVHRIKNKL